MSALDTLPVNCSLHCHSLPSLVPRPEKCRPPLHLYATDCMAQETHYRNKDSDKNMAHCMNQLNYKTFFSYCVCI